MRVDFNVTVVDSFVKSGSWVNLVRVIAGNLRGRRLAPPEWAGLRPSSDRLRETLFNVLGPACNGARVLDLCAGTGAVGIEAISRGATKVTFVDADARACRLIEQNLRSCQVSEGYTIVQSAVEDAVRRLTGGFSIVFLDPSYDEPDLDRMVELAASQAAHGGVLVVEHTRRRNLPAEAGGLVRARELKTGDSILSFYRWPGG